MTGSTILKGFSVFYINIQRPDNQRLSVMCKHCGCAHDRDIDGARNILFRQMFLALRDPSTPCLV